MQLLFGLPLAFGDHTERFGSVYEDRADTTDELRAADAAKRPGDGQKTMEAGKNWGIFDWMCQFLQTEWELEQGTKALMQSLAQQLTELKAQQAARASNLPTLAAVGSGSFPRIS